MSELAKIQHAVEQLSEDELKQFRAWFEELQAKLWDEQIERDFASGKLDARAEKWRADFKAGKVSDL
jgi:hypothetical protein